MVKSNEEALRELLRLMADNPGLADRITITKKIKSVGGRQPPPPS